MHTPGPWEVRWDKSLQRKLPIAIMGHADTDRKSVVLKPFSSGMFVCSDSDLALIAAAPELLAMLERLLPYLREAAILLPEIGRVCRDVSEAESLIKRVKCETN